MEYSAMIKCINWMTVILILNINFIVCVDIKYTEIYTVTDETRFTVLHPEATLTAFSKQRNVKGNIIFTAGERVPGDRHLANVLDESQNTKAEDIEIVAQYPAKGGEGSTITFIEIYASLSSEDADSFFFEGGISQKFAHILIACNRTRHFSYEIFMYGY